MKTVMIQILLLKILEYQKKKKLLVSHLEREIFWATIIFADY